jgi:hypothetical protein
VSEPLEAGEAWIPYPFVRRERPAYFEAHFYAMFRLAVITNQINSYFFTDNDYFRRESSTAAGRSSSESQSKHDQDLEYALERYNDLVEWLQELPSELDPRKNSTAHNLVLQYVLLSYLET